MAATSLDPRLNVHIGKNNHQHGGGGVVVEEIEGLIRVYKDGHIERPPIVPNVSSCSLSPELGVTSRDVIIDKLINLWVRFYVPSCSKKLMPLLVYFHGGGFCVGSASWACYHNFLANLSSKACCVIVSVNYRLAPENRLPVPYEDGFNAIMWLKQQASIGSIEHKWWLSQCNFSSLFLAGDSAGANVAYHVATRLGSTNLRPFCIKGMILIQPFFGGESHSESEKYSIQPMDSALKLSSSDTYWRLALPLGANRDHPWCNPFAKGAPKLGDLRLPSMMVCVSDLDILKDRNIEFCNTMAGAGKRVEKVIYKGVGHAFQVLHNSQYSQPRTHEMMSHLKAFINQ